MTSSWIPRAALILIAAVLGACAASDPNAPRKLSEDVSVSGQITVANVKALKDKGFKTIVNMRPDNESPDQAKYTQMQGAVAQAGLAYGYIPVRKTGPIPATSAESLNSVLKLMPKPVLVYAETADRPVEVWALAQALQPGGPDKAAILESAKSAGFNVDNLAPELDARIAKRPKR